MTKHFFIIVIIFVLSLDSYAQSIECVESWNKFDLLKSPVDYKYKAFISVSELNKTESKGLILEVKNDESVKYDCLIKGKRLTLTNWSDSTIQLKVNLMDLKLVCQVKDDTGDWKDIENSFPESFCSYGVQYFDLTLRSGEYIKLKAPCYKGEKNVIMKYRLDFKGLTLYSSEFQGFINLQQLE